MIAGLLHSRIHLNLREFRQQNHMTFFSNVLAILELLQPLVFHGDHQGALQDCLLSFMKVLQVGISCCQTLSDAGFRFGIWFKYGQISVSNVCTYLCPCRTFKALACRWFSSISFCSSRRSTSPTMLQQPFLIYRNTPTSYSKFPLQMTPNLSSCCSERWYSYCFCDLSSRVLCAENPDLVQLKSLLAGLTLPVKSSSAEVAAEERDGKPRTNVLMYRTKISK